MAAVATVQFKTSPLKSNVLQATNTNKSERREIIVVKQKPQILTDSKHFTTEDILITSSSKKRLTKNGKDTRSTQPLAVARRNARERNRVKQVNNGFATLRQHIPNFIAHAFESTNGRGGNKKLSKVETLRMAVEYIRSLEDILASDDSSDNGNNSNSSISPTIVNANQRISFSYPTLSSPSIDDDQFSTNSTPPPQFIRIGTSSKTYQIIHSRLYDDNENMAPPNDHLITDSVLLNDSLQFTTVQDLSLLNQIHTRDSLSPELYSDESLSPSEFDKHNSDSFLVHFKETHKNDIKENQIKVEEIDDSLPFISLKVEDEHQQEKTPHVIDVIQWWEQHPSRTIS